MLDTKHTGLAGAAIAASVNDVKQFLQDAASAASSVALSIEEVSEHYALQIF